MLLSVFKNVVRGFSLVHDPEGSHYENLEGNGDKRSGRSGLESQMWLPGSCASSLPGFPLGHCEAHSAEAISAGMKNDKKEGK